MMNYAHLFETLLATAAGGLIAVATIWIKDHLDRKNKIQDWFFESYIDNGIDPLLNILYELNILYFDANVDFHAKKHSDLLSMPIESLNKITTLLDSHDFYTMYLSNRMFLETNADEFLNDENLHITTDRIRTMIKFMDSLKEELIKVHIRHRKDVYQISKREKIRSLKNELKESLEKQMKLKEK